MQKLLSSKVVIFGIGGVGSFATEAIARAGVGSIDLVDGDVIDITNINRQLIADMRTIGRPKVEVMKDRLVNINNNIKVNAFFDYYTKETEANYSFLNYDYVVDAIDMVTSKLLIIEKAKSSNVPVISSMGMGGKLNPLEISIEDIYNTSVCPLARVMRRELKNIGIKDLNVVYSKEKPYILPRSIDKAKVIPSISFVPSVAGMILAGQVVRDIINNDLSER